MKNLQMVLNLDGYNPSETYNFGNLILSAMTGNSNFTNPFPVLTDLSTALADLKTAIGAWKPGDKSLTTAQYDRQAKVGKVLKAMAAYVEYVSPSEEVALSSGFSLKAARTSVARTFMAKNGSQSGVAELVTKRQGNSAYVWQYTKDPVGSVAWTDAGVSMHASFIVSGLTPMTTYWFRVAVVNADGQQAWSDPYHLAVV